MKRILTMIALVAFLTAPTHASFAPISQLLEAGPTGVPVPAHYSTSVSYGAELGTHTWGYHNQHDSTAPGPTYTVISNSDVTTTLTADQIVLNLKSTALGHGGDFADAGSRATVHILVPDFSSIKVVATTSAIFYFGSEPIPASGEDGWKLTDLLGKPISDGPVPAGEYILMGQSKITRAAGIDYGSTVNVTLTVAAPEPAIWMLVPALLLLTRGRN